MELSPPLLSETLRQFYELSHSSTSAYTDSGFTAESSPGLLYTVFWYLPCFSFTLDDKEMFTRKKKDKLPCFEGSCTLSRGAHVKQPYRTSTDTSSIFAFSLWPFQLHWLISAPHIGLPSPFTTNKLDVTRKGQMSPLYDLPPPIFPMLSQSYFSWIACTPTKSFRVLTHLINNWRWRSSTKSKGDHFGAEKYEHLVALIFCTAYEVG